MLRRRDCLVLREKNKTDSRSSLKLDGTLSSILAMKSRFQESVVPCYKWQPEEEVLKNAKKATLNYNKKMCVKTVKL